MNMIFEEGEVPNDFRKTLIKNCIRKVIRAVVNLRVFPSENLQQVRL